MSLRRWKQTHEKRECYGIPFPEIGERSGGHPDFAHVLPKIAEKSFGIGAGKDGAATVFEDVSIGGHDGPLVGLGEKMLADDARPPEPLAGPQ